MDHSHSTSYTETKHSSETPWGITDVVFVYFCVFILSIIFAGILLYTNIDINRNVYSVVFQTLLSLSILGLIYVIVTKKYEVPFKQAFGISFSKIPSFLNQGIFVTAIIVVTTTIIGLIFTQIIGTENKSPYMDMPGEKFRWLTLFAIFFAPIVEEIFFRGFMQPAIVKKTGTVFGILITALIFGVSHTQYMNFGAAIFSVTAIGLILGITRHKTGSVMPGIFAHFFNNLLAVIYILT